MHVHLLPLVARPSLARRFLPLRRPYCRVTSPEQCLQEAITPQVAAGLATRGYAVLDNVFGKSLCSQLLSEIKELRRAGLMALNNTHIVRGGERKLLQKSSIYEADLLREEVFTAAPQFAALQRDTGLRTMLSLFMPHLRLDAQAIKLQYNTGGGGCFPLHFDSDEAVDTRRVTAIVYLNAGWQHSDGGQLRLFPSLGAPVDIEPVNDRLLLFSSCRMLHRVLPSAAERYCFSIWMSDSRTKAAPPLPLPKLFRAASAMKGLEGLTSHNMQQLLKEPELRKCLSKLAHAEEWRESLLQSHPDSPARLEAVADFERDIALLHAQLASLGVGMDEWTREAESTPPPAWF